MNSFSNFFLKKIQREKEKEEKNEEERPGRHRTAAGDSRLHVRGPDGAARCPALRCAMPLPAAEAPVWMPVSCSDFSAPRQASPNSVSCPQEVSTEAGPLLVTVTRPGTGRGMTLSPATRWLYDHRTAPEPLCASLLCL